MVALWRACFDESSDGQREEDFLVGGVIAEKRQWRRFYAAWAETLKKGRPLRYYSSKDAGMREDPRSAFFGWTDDQVHAKRLSLAALIRKHLGPQIVCAMRLDYFNPIAKAAPEIPQPWNDPYLAVFAMSLQSIAKHMNEAVAPAYANPRKPLIIYDRLTSAKHKGRVCAIHDSYLQAPPGHALYHVARWLQEPLFMADDSSPMDEPGVQAADLIAGAYRHARHKAKERPKELGDLPTPAEIEALGGSLLGIALQPPQIELWKTAILSLVAEREKERLAAKAARRAALPPTSASSDASS